MSRTPPNHSRERTAPTIHEVGNKLQDFFQDHALLSQLDLRDVDDLGNADTTEAVIKINSFATANAYLLNDRTIGAVIPNIVVGNTSHGKDVMGALLAGHPGLAVSGTNMTTAAPVHTSVTRGPMKSDKDLISARFRGKEVYVGSDYKEYVQAVSNLMLGERQDKDNKQAADGGNQGALLFHRPEV